VRTKYGTDLIYELYSKAEVEEENQGICTLKHDKFNVNLVAKCRKLGGRWDSSESAWVFSAIVEDKVDEIDAIYNSKSVTVEITAKERISEHTDSVCFFGYTIARACGRDTGAKLGEGVSQIEGKIGSAGSMKNWATEVTKGSIFRLTVPKDLLSDSEDDEWEVIIKE